MRTRWIIGRRRPEDRIERGFRKAVLRMPSHQRCDAVLHVGAAIALVALVLVGVGLVGYGRSAGWFDKSVVQRLADPRKLVNLRDDLIENALLDAVYHEPDGRVYISQEGGNIHRYDPATGLWSTQVPFAGQPVSSNFVLLRSGCGTDPLSDHLADCPDPDALWLLGSDGSLALQRDGDWQVILSNTFFMGADGRPVSSDDLTTAAISDDGRWLALGTRSQGLGLYDLQVRRWVPVNPEATSVLKGKEISLLRFWKGSLWLAVPEGLLALRLDVRGTGVPTEVIAGAHILDLEREQDHLWILAERPCKCAQAGGSCKKDEGKSCLWLGLLDQADGPLSTVLDEGNRYLDLDLTGVSHAQYWGDRLALAGKSGVYLYDPEYHTWERLFTGVVRVVLPETQNLGFYFGYAGGVGLVDSSFTPQIWPITDEVVTRLVKADGEVLALTESGNVWSIADSGETTQVFRRGATALDPTKFNAALAVGSTVIFLGPEGVLLHDVRTRQYEDVLSPPAEFPAWLVNEETRFVTTSNTVFAVESSADGTTVYLLPADNLADPHYYGRTGIGNATAIALPGRAMRLWPWEPYGLGVISEDGRVFLLNSSGAVAQTGSTSPLRLSEFVDVGETQDTLIVAGQRDLYSYSLSQRKWSDYPGPDLANGEEIAELAIVNGGLLMRTSLGRLLQDAAVPPERIGDPAGFQITDLSLSDAMAANQTYYLAGQGLVQAYDADRRQIVETWDISGQTSVQLKAIAGGQPVSLSAGVAYVGEQALDPEAGAVLQLSTDAAYVWTVRDAGDHRFLEGHALDALTDTGKARCFFRQPWAEGAAEALDARLLPDQTVAVATADGLRLYSPAARSWYRTAPDPIPSGGQLYLLDSGAGKSLLAVEPASDNKWQLNFLPWSGIRLPHSCATSPAEVGIETSATAVAYDVNEQTGQVAWIGSDGVVWEWVAGRQTQVLAALSNGPQPRELQHVYERDGQLLMVTHDSLWRYDLILREWQAIDLDLPEGSAPVADLNVERATDYNMVTVHTSDGSFYLGELADLEKRVQLSRIYQSVERGFGVEGSELVDVQQRSSEPWWTFVATNRVQYYQPVERRWLTSEQIASSTPLDFQEALGWGVLVGDGGEMWWVASERTAHPVNFTKFERNLSDTAIALDSERTIWRLLPDGQIQQCVPQDDSYVCQQQRTAAFQLNPDELHYAIEWNGFVLFETADGLRAYDTNASEEAPLAAEAATFAAGLATYQVENRLHIYNGTSLLSLDPELESDLQLDVRNVIIDPQGRLWADVSGNWSYLVDGKWRSMSASMPAAQGIRLFVVPGFNVSALDAAGFAYSWTGTDFLREDLPFPSSATGVDQLIHGQQSDWWTLTGNRLERLERTTCTSLLRRDRYEKRIWPCIRAVGGVDLPFDDVSFAQPLANGGIELRSPRGELAAVGLTATRQFSVTLTTVGASRPDYQIDDRWAGLSANVALLPNGQTAYDPVTSLAVGSGGELLSRRSAGRDEALADRAVLAGTQTGVPFAVPQALDAGWLRWDRSAQSFVVQSSTGALSLGPDEFIQNGQLIFEDVVAVLAANRAETYAASPYGVWRFDQSDLRLNTQVVYFPPTSQTRRIEGASHGRFLAGNQEITARPTGLFEAPRGDITLQVDAVTFVERMVTDRLEASLMVSGQKISGFDEQGFVWDAGRRGVAYEGNTLFLQSDAGIHEARQLAGFDAGPDRLALASGQVLSDGKGGLYLSYGGRWYKRESGTWTAKSADPIADGVLATTSYWEWSKHAHRVEVGLAAQPLGFDIVQNAHGFGFSSDKMRAAAAYKDRLYVVTDAFLEVASSPDELAGLSASRQSSVASDALETIRFADGQVSLYNYAGQGLSRWNDQQGVFSAVAADTDPARHRLLVETSRLRLTWMQNRVLKEVWIDSLDSQGRWIAFEFYHGRFPFDYVTSLATFDGRVYVGTAAGVQIYANPAATGLDKMAQLLDTRAQPSGSLEPITQLGVPASYPDQIMALSPRGCIQQRKAQPFALCDDPGRLQLELKVRDGFWQWATTADGQPLGQYVAHDGTLGRNPIRLIDGLWPHDKLADAVIWNKHIYTLWDGGWVSAHSGPGLAIDGQTSNYPLVELAPSRFIALDRGISMSRSDLPAGLYLEGEDSRMWVLASTDWREVTDAKTIADLQQLADSPPVFYSSRLRLLGLKGIEGLGFEQRSVDGQWHSLPWLSTGSVAIDAWRDMVWANDQLWVATPIGIVSFERAGGAASAIVADPESLHVVRDPLEQGQVCQVSDLRLAGDLVQARCDSRSDLAYEGKLSAASDSGVFSKTNSDSFAEQPLVTTEGTGYWSFSLKGRAGGDPGFLEASLKSGPGSSSAEAIQLVGGRFDFDTLTSLALFQDGQVELATEQGGWYRAPRGTKIKVQDLSRWLGIVEYREVNRVNLTRVADRLLLGLHVKDGCVLLEESVTDVADGEGPRLVVTGKPTTCPELQGAASFWLYESENNQLQIKAPGSRGGQGVRSLSEGRFGDDVALGLPVTKQSDEGPRYFLPTVSGVVELDEQLEDATLYAVKEPTSDHMPAVLYVADAITATFLAGDTFYDLGDSSREVAGPMLAQTADQETLAIEAGPRDLIRVQWRRAGGRGWSLVSPEGSVYGEENALPVDVGSFYKFRQEQAACGWPAAHTQLDLIYNPGELEIRLGGEHRSFDLPPGFDLLAPILYKDRLLLIGRQDALDISLQRAIVELCAEVPFISEGVVLGAKYTRSESAVLLNKYIRSEFPLPYEGNRYQMLK